MQLGMIGLGRMGANIVRRLLQQGHAAVVFDRDPAPGLALTREGAVAASSLADVVSKMTSAVHPLGNRDCLGRELRLRV